MFENNFKNIIVTGANGFIGKHLVKQLVDLGCNVTILSRNINKSKLIFDTTNISIIECDLCNIDQFDFPFENCDVFYNLAWDGVNGKLKDDFVLQTKNITMSMKIAEFAKRINTKLFISAGTVAEYVFAEKVMNVYEKQTPNDMYGAAKVSVHYFLDVFTRNSKLPFIWCIIPSAYGEGRKDNNILTYTINTLLNGEKPLYGNLNQMWDFLYVEEIARALVLIGKYGKSQKIYGIGSGIYKPLIEYIKIIRDKINPNLPLGVGEKPELSVKTFSSCVNINELTKDTGFRPKIYFEEGIERTILWYKNMLIHNNINYSI